MNKVIISSVEQDCQHIVQVSRRPASRNSGSSSTDTAKEGPNGSSVIVTESFAAHLHRVEGFPCLPIVIRRATRYGVDSRTPKLAYSQQHQRRCTDQQRRLAGEARCKPLLAIDIRVVDVVKAILARLSSFGRARATRLLRPLNNLVDDHTPDAELAIECLPFFHGLFCNATRFGCKGNFCAGMPFLQGISDYSQVVFLLFPGIYLVVSWR